MTDLHFPSLSGIWQHGDRFIPLGMKGYKKLSDFFVDQKIDTAEKRNIFILTDATTDNLDNIPQARQQVQDNGKIQRGYLG